MGGMANNSITAETIAGVLGDALVVNPYNVEHMVDSIHYSLSMHESEKRSRMRTLRRAVKQSDVYWWCRTFLKSLAGLRKGAGRQQNLFTARKVS